MRPDSRPVRLAAAILFLAVSGSAAARLWGPFAAAWIARGEAADPAVYQRALRRDPANPDYHFTAAEIYHLSARHQDSRRALAHYEEAVRGNPDRSAHWLGLSKLLEALGDAPGARRAMAKAIETDPHYARTHWAAANLYLRLGDLDAADAALARTADLDAGFLDQILDLVWRYYQDPARIVTTYVPDTKAGNLAALRYFILRESEDGSRLAWNRLGAFPTAARERLAYVEYLIGLGEPHRAYDVFLRDADRPAVFNGGFEDELLNGGFDWRFPTRGPAAVRRDATRSDEGRSSLMIEFDGEENPNFSGVWHWLPVEAGTRYELSFRMRTEEVSTDQGVYVEVDGETSDPILGTTPWRERAIRFTASSDLVRVRVRRDATRKFDNRLRGRVWLDDFRLVAPE